MDSFFDLMATFFEFTAYGTDLWPPTAPSTLSTIHPTMPWTSPPPTSTPPTVHHHPGHQHDQPHYQFPSTAYPTLTPGPPDHLFGQPTALQSSWSTLTPVSTVHLHHQHSQSHYQSNPSFDTFTSTSSNDAFGLCSMPNYTIP